MVTLSKICVVALTGQAAVALPHAMNRDTNDNFDVSDVQGLDFLPGFSPLDDVSEEEGRGVLSAEDDFFNEPAQILCKREDKESNAEWVGKKGEKSSPSEAAARKDTRGGGSVDRKYFQWTIDPYTAKQNDTVKKRGLALIEEIREKKIKENTKKRAIDSTIVEKNDTLKRREVSFFSELKAMILKALYLELDEHLDGYEAKKKDKGGDSSDDHPTEESEDVNDAEGAETSHASNSQATPSPDASNSQADTHDASNSQATPSPDASNSQTDTHDDDEGPHRGGMKKPGLPPPAIPKLPESPYAPVQKHMAEAEANKTDYRAKYKDSQSTGSTTETTLPASDVPKPEYTVRLDTRAAAPHDPSDSPFLTEGIYFGASPAEEEDSKETETSSAKDTVEEEKGQEAKDKYGSVEKRAQYDQQWADYYNKAGAYEGLDYDPHEYLKEYEKALPENQRQCNQPVQQPQPAPEEKPTIIPAPQQPRPPPQQAAPTPQGDAPIIIPAPQRPTPQRPAPQQAPKPQQPAPVPAAGQQSQPGQENSEDFVMFVPKDQSDGSEPYMVPANEYNPATPPQPLPCGLTPPPPPASRGPTRQQGLKPETIQKANGPVNVPLPVEKNQPEEAPEKKPEEPLTKPAGPPGGKLSEAPHTLPDWFPTRPGSLCKRDEPKKSEGDNTPFGKFRQLVERLGDTSKTKARKEAADQKAQDSMLPPTAAENRLKERDLSETKSTDAKVGEFEDPPKRSLELGCYPSNWDSASNGRDSHLPGVDRRATKPHPKRAFIELNGSGNSPGAPPRGSRRGNRVSLSRFRGRLPAFKHPEPQFSECREPDFPCPDYGYPQSPPSDPEHLLCEPSHGPCPEHEQPQLEYRPVLHTGGYPQAKSQPEPYPGHEKAKPEYHKPECQTCGSDDGSYPSHLNYPSPRPELSHPHVEYEPPYEPQEPCPECVYPNLQHDHEPEPERHADEKPSEPAPHSQEPCYICEQPEPHTPEPTKPMPTEPVPQTDNSEPQHLEPEPKSETYLPHPYESAPEPQTQPDQPHKDGSYPYASSEFTQPSTGPDMHHAEPCHTCGKPEESTAEVEQPSSGPNFRAPQPEYPPEDGSYPLNDADSHPPQSFEHAPAPETESQHSEPCHTCEQVPGSEKPPSGPNFKQPQPEDPPQDGSYPIKDSESDFVPETDSQPQEACHTCEQPSKLEEPPSGPNFKQPQPEYPPQDGSYPIEDSAAHQPPVESPGPPPPPESVGTPPETVGHPPKDAHVHPDGSYSFNPAEHPEVYPEYEPPQVAPAPKPTVPWHFPSGAIGPSAEAEQKSEASGPEPQPGPEQGGCPCEQGQKPQSSSGSSCAC